MFLSLLISIALFYRVTLAFEVPEAAKEFYQKYFTLPSYIQQRPPASSDSHSLQTKDVIEYKGFFLDTTMDSNGNIDCTSQSKSFH